MKEKSPLQSERITLRAPEISDLDFMFRIENDTRLWVVSACKTPYSRYQLHQYITENRHDIYADRQLRLMIEKSNGETIGAVDLIDFNPSSHRAEVGIVIVEEERGKGYAGETLTLLRRYTKEILDIHQLYAYVYSDNTAAWRLFEKAGFIATATLKEWEYNNGRYKDVSIFQLIMQ